MRDSFLPFALPDTDEAEIAAVAEVIRSGWLTSGVRVQQFEREFAARVGAPHAVAVNSCTAALHLALEAVGVRRGDEVITTPLTFAATAEVVRYFDARPVLVDVCPDTLNLDPQLIEAAITPRTRVILPVHLAGLPAEMNTIMDIARRHELAVVEDAAHALPATYGGRPIGTWGDITCFSFYATKTLTTGEGGMLCTANAAWADRCRLMSLHGISHNAWNRYSAAGSWYYEIIAPGYKYNLTDIAAAIGLVQLNKLERMWARRAAIAQRYTAAFSRWEEVQPPPVAPADGQHAWHLYLLRLNLERLTIDRAQFMDELKARRIGASVHFMPLHLHPYYRELYGYRPTDYPVAYGEYWRLVSLPIYSRMTDADVQTVIAAVEDILARYRRRG